MSTLKPAERAILQHAMLGLSANTIAQRTSIATSTVRDILTQHGGDLEAWQAALDLDSDTGQVHPADVDPYEVEVKSKVEYRAPGRVVVQPPQPDPMPGSIAQLLKRAEAGDAKCKRLAKRIHADIFTLKDHLDWVEAKAAAKQAEADKRAAAVAEVKRLTAELAAARKLAGSAPRVGMNKAARSDSAAVRAWAQEQGLTTSTTGKMPAHVTAAYKEAHSDG